VKPTAAGLARLARGFAVAGIVISVLVFRVLWSARDELGQAQLLEQQGELDGAIVHYRRAARWYAPGSPYHVRALDKLSGIGAKAEADGDTERALSAYRAVRGSIMAARSFYVPEQGRLRAADLRIADLMAGLPPPGMDAGKSKDQLRAEHLALLEHNPDPSIAWTLVLLAGFAAWVSEAFVFSVRAIDENDRFVWTEARKWGALIVLGFALFVMGMVLA
jgi:tetratricopeptide (TPR) repeat protein